MVSLRPDHPHPMVVAHPVGGRGRFSAFPTPSASPTRRGRHRTRIAYAPYRSKHRDTEQKLGVARLLPNWRRRESGALYIPRSSMPSHISPTDIQPRSQQESATPDQGKALREGAPPQPATKPSPSATHAVGVPILETPRKPDSPEDITLPEPSPTPDGSGVLVTTTRRPYRSRFVNELARSWLIPQAHPSEGSSLAAILGFGETQASFANYQADQSMPISPAELTDSHWQDLPTLSSVTAQLDRPGNTGDAVKLLWESTAESDPEHGTISSEFGPVEYDFRSGKRLRWSMVLSIAVLVVLVATTARLLTDLPGRQAQEREVQYAESAQRLYGSLAPLHQTLSDGGLLSDSGLAALTDHIHTLDEAAREAITLASLELPGSSILGSNETVENLAITRRSLDEAATRSLEVAQRIGYAMAYSLSIADVLDLPALPENASLADAGVIAEELSRTVAEARSTLGALPEEVVFQPYLQETNQTMSTLEASQADYVAALRTGDEINAARASESISVSVEGIRSGLAAPLDDLQDWAITEIWNIDQMVQQIR